MIIDLQGYNAVKNVKDHRPTSAKAEAVMTAVKVLSNILVPVRKKSQNINMPVFYHEK